VRILRDRHESPQLGQLLGRLGQAQRGDRVEHLAAAVFRRVVEIEFLAGEIARPLRRLAIGHRQRVDLPALREHRDVRLERLDGHHAVDAVARLRRLEGLHFAVPQRVGHRALGQEERHRAVGGIEEGRAAGLRALEEVQERAVGAEREEVGRVVPGDEAAREEDQRAIEAREEVGAALSVVHGGPHPSRSRR
jgi:hypothetical protein